MLKIAKTMTAIVITVSLCSLFAACGKKGPPTLPRTEPESTVTTDTPTPQK